MRVWPLWALFLVLAAVILGAIILIGKTKLEKEVTVAIIAAAVTLISSVLVVSITHYSTKTKEVAEAHRLKKTEVYGEFSDLVFSIFRLIKIPSREDLTPEERTQLELEARANLEERYSSFSKKLLLWGSPEVIDSWLEYLERSRSVDVSSETAQAESIRNLLYMDDVFRAMRDDLELSNRGLEEGDLVKAFLQDPHLLDPYVGTRK